MRAIRLVVKTATLIAWVLLVVAVVVRPALGQTDAALEESADSRYYDFWPGIWLEVVDEADAASATKFVVRRTVNPAAYEERWWQTIDGVRHESTALRGWDQVSGRWILAWVSDNALFQVWHGEKSGEHWSMVKEFSFAGETFLSRQTWRPTGQNQLERTLARSVDGGATWTIRYRSAFVRVEE